MEFFIIILIVGLSVFSIIKKFYKDSKIENKCSKCNLKSKHKINL
ncbi:MAG: hypothetical protein K1060chlam5_00872 [Candidatus Anoxychlamydiales bacterium]|nr:hypothetical protein [Candidatus Anoxychlamydiales bacterium]